MRKTWTLVRGGEEVAMSGQLVLDRDAIGELCRKHGVRRLVVFGSAVTDRFDESRSDVDFLVEFDNPAGGQFDAYFAASVTKSGRELYAA